MVNLRQVVMRFDSVDDQSMIDIILVGESMSSMIVWSVDRRLAIFLTDFDDREEFQRQRVMMVGD